MTKLAKLGAVSKLAGLKGDGNKGNQDVVVVYVKDDHKKHGHHHSGGNRWDSSEEDHHYVYRKPVRKVRPVKWESYEDSDEYVRPIHVKRPSYSHSRKPVRVVKPVYVTGWDHDDNDSKDKWGNWGNWGNWFNKGGNGGNKWNHGDDSDETQTIVIKKKGGHGGHSSGGHSSGGHRWEDNDSDEYTHGGKWSKYD